MDKLLAYLNSLHGEDRAAFVAGTGTSEGYLRKACSAGDKLRPELCLSIEVASAGKVKRVDLREDWESIWPHAELAAVGALP